MRVGMRQFARGVTMLAVIAMAACASSGTTTDTPAASGGTGGAGNTTLPITIVNDYGAAQHFTLFIEPAAGGVRTSLGEVEVGVTKTFTFTGAFGQYVFVGQSTSGNTTSPRFNHTGSNRITWDRSTNRVLTNSR